MITLENSEVYSGNPAVAAPAVAALNDILRQRMNREQAKLFRRVERTITKQAEEVAAEHKRLIALYSPKNTDGEPLPLNSADDLTDKRAFEKEYDDLINDSFEVEGIPAKELDGMSLAGATWVARIVVEDEAAPPKKNDASE